MLAALAALLCALTAQTAVAGGVIGALVFEDDFDGPLNTSKWHVQDGPHGHGVNTAANAFTSNGSLVLRTVARNQSVQGTQYYVASSAVDTSQSLAQEYGAWEARLRMPNVADTAGFRLHSSMWLVNMLPWIAANGSACGGSGHKSPEIDLVEYDLKEWTNVDKGPGPWAEGHLHVFFDNCTQRWAPAPDRYLLGGRDADFHSDFHVWRLEWLQDSLTMLVDGAVLLRVTDADYLRGLAGPLYFLLTNTVMTSMPPSATDVLPQTMLVDYVRIWTAAV